MKSRHPRPQRSTYVASGAAAVCALAVLVSMPIVSQAQEFDRQAYEQVAQECVNNLEYAEQAMGTSNVDRALTYIQLALDPCDSARNLLITGMSSSDLSTRQRQALQGDLVSQDSRWATLAAQMGLCEEARNMLAETVRIVPDIPSDRQQRYMAASQAVLTCTPSANPGMGTPGTGTPAAVPHTPTIPAGGSLNGTVTVGPGYGPASGSGLAGGPADANQTFPEPCWGAISSEPNFTLIVTSDSWVSAVARSDGDLTMIVSGPNGTFCNDDFDGLNPGLREWLTAGTYSVWIGEFTRSQTGTAFAAEFSTDAGTPVAANVVPTYGYVTVGPGYAATAGAGMAGGLEDANSLFGEPCRGAIPSVPQYQLEVTGHGLVTTQITSPNDLTLIISGPNGTFCNDDFDGLNPAISEVMAAGTYHIYIGEYSRSATGSTYDARFSTEPLVPSGQQGATGGVQPTYGTAYVGPGHGMTTLNGVSGGTLDASMSYGSTCVGQIAQTPDFLLEVTQAATVNVTVSATDNGDTSLVITGPGGTFCNDDSNGLNPGLSQYLSPGTYSVFVGSYYQGEYHNVVVNFASY